MGKTLDPEYKAERAAAIIRARTANVSFDEIGRQWQISGARACQVYQEALVEIPALALDEHRREMLGTIELGTRQLIGIGMDLTVEAQVRINAWTAVRGFVAERAKITGGYAPTKSLTLSMDAIEAEIARTQGEIDRVLASMPTEDGELESAGGRVGSLESSGSLELGSG